MNSHQWASNEPSSAISSETFLLAGHFLGAVGFGVHLTLFVWCFNLLYFKKKTRSDWVYIVYICTLFILCNIGNAATLKFTSMAFIEHRGYPGGPFAFYMDKDLIPISFLSNIILAVNNWLQDSLILYRFWIIYDGNKCLVALPGALLVASVALAITIFVKWSQGTTGMMKDTIDLAIPFWSFSIAINAILVVLIGGRLLYRRYCLRRLTGMRNSDYLSITTMLVESTALYTLNALWAIIPYALHHPSQHLARPLLGQTQAIAPLLVILRVAQRRAWTRNTMANLTSIVNHGNVLDFHHSQDMSTFQAYSQPRDSITDMNSTLNKSHAPDNGEKSSRSSGGPMTKVQVQV